FLFGGSLKPSIAGVLRGVDKVNGAVVGGACVVGAVFVGFAGAYLG
ncbi:MAG: hypothetical protein K0Q60_4934, partial [Microvirga sp.]|nr:hypothetical protein [Microvirga sp.]